MVVNPLCVRSRHSPMSDDGALQYRKAVLA